MIRWRGQRRTKKREVQADNRQSHSEEMIPLNNQQATTSINNVANSDANGCQSVHPDNKKLESTKSAANCPDNANSDIENLDTMSPVDEDPGIIKPEVKDLGSTNADSVNLKIKQPGKESTTSSANQHTSKSDGDNSSAVEPDTTNSDSLATADTPC